MRLPMIRRLIVDPSQRYVDKGGVMIQAIGIMMAAYIITRMVDLICLDERFWLPKVFAFGTIIVTGLAAIFLLAGGASSISP